MNSPLDSSVLFTVGPVPISTSVATVWAIMVILSIVAVVVRRGLALVPSTTQALFELIVDAVDSQIRATMRVDPAPYRAFIGSLFVFILVCIWSALVPGM